MGTDSRLRNVMSKCKESDFGIFVLVRDLVTF
jgi:hypothetical protein